MARNRIVKAGAVPVPPVPEGHMLIVVHPSDVPQPPAVPGDAAIEQLLPPTAAGLIGDAGPEILGASIDPSVAAPGNVTVNVTNTSGITSSDAAAIVEAVAKANKRAKKDDEPAAEPRQATIAEMMAQSLRNHQEHTDRAAAIAELQKQLKNL